MTDEEKVALKAEFVRRCRHLLEHEGEIHEASVNLPRMGQITIGPVEIHGMEENWEQIRAGSLWPPRADGATLFLFVDPRYPDREQCLYPVLEEYIKILRQHMVLDDLAEIPDD